MGIQVVVKTGEAKTIGSALGSVVSQYEIFSIGNGLFGLSIPANVVAAIGEENARAKLAALEYFDLWEGVWRKPRPKPKWKFW
jgi:hypothetical protein